MLDNYCSRYPRRAPPTRGADGEEILEEMLKHAYDGIGMMKELLTWLDRGTMQRDKDLHVAVISAMRRTVLPDNCTADDFLDRLQTMQENHNRFLDKSERVTKEAMSRFILAIMPKSLEHIKNALLFEMKTTPLAASLTRRHSPRWWRHTSTLHTSPT